MRDPVCENVNFFSIKRAVASSLSITKSKEPELRPETFSLINDVCIPDQCPVVISTSIPYLVENSLSM